LILKKKQIYIYISRWFVIKDTYIVYLRPDTNEVRFPMLVDRAFEFVSGLRAAGTYRGIKIKNLQRKLVIKCKNTRDCDEWAQHLTQLTERAKSFRSVEASRFNSYAPVRQNQLAHW
jgi:phospholipase D1/2